MLDIKFIRDHKDIVAAGAKKKHMPFDVEALIRADNDRRKLLQEVEDMRAKQNAASDKISTAADDTEREQFIGEMRTLKEELQKKEEELKEAMKTWQELMVNVPNVPDMSVPDGKTDADNQEITTWGELPEQSFAPKSHIDLMQDLDMVDFTRGVKLSGFRGYVLKNDGARLSFALWQYAFDMMLKKGYDPMIVPSLVGRAPFVGTGYLPQSEEDLYKTQDESYLSGTAEVPMMGYYMDETVELGTLPIKVFGFSPCFRREAGSYGKDTKGLIRVHEFYKIEQVILSEASHEKSVQLHEELRQNAEEIMQGLGIPYHVVVNCAGDLGLGQVKKYDIEAWVPSEKAYRETHSASYFHDFQTRRLNIRYRDAEGKLRFAHSLNSTALPTPRILVSLVENYQNEDGSIRIPDVLKPYMGKDAISKSA